MTYGVILEAMEQLRDLGVDTQYHQPRTIWPILDETLRFIKKCKRVYVVEHNAVGQLAHLLMHQGANSDKLIKVLKYDGTPFIPSELTHKVMIKEKKHIKSVKNLKREATLQ